MANNPVPNSPDLQPGLQTPAPNSSSVPPSAPPPVAGSGTNPGNPSGGNRRKGKGLAIILIGLLVIAIGAFVGVRFYQARHNPTTTVKKDVPLLTFGAANNGEVPQYPTRYLGSNTDVQVAAQLFEGLVGYKDQTKIVPLLATSWSNPDSSTWVFNLRQGVKFHSGRTMTAQDVKYSLDYAVAHQNDNDGNSVLLQSSTIKQVDVTGPYQVKITTNGPDPVLLNRLFFLGIMDAKAKLGDYNAGTGPYTVKPGTTPTTTSIDLQASNSYWGGHVYTREVKFTIYSNADQQVADSASGKLDLAGDFDASQLSKIKHYQPVYMPDQGLSYDGIDTQRANSPLHTLAARQAVAYALNPPAILKTAGLQGQQTSQLVPLLLPGHDPSIPNTPYDPAKAKQLLATVPNAGAPLTFAYATGDDQEVNEMTKELEAVGFTIKPVAVDDFDTFINDTNAGKYDLFYGTYSSNTLDGLDILSNLLTSVQYYDNPQVDSLIDQAGSTLDPTARISLMQKVAGIVATDKPIIPLYTVTRVYALTKPYAVTVDMPSIGPYFWKVYQK